MNDETVIDIDYAINGFNNIHLVPGNTIGPFEIGLNKSKTIDISNLFYSPENSYTISVKSISNQAIANAVISEKTIIVTGENLGNTEITLLAEDTTGSDETSFEVIISDHSSILYSEDFEGVTNEWTYANTIYGWRYGEKSDFGASPYWTFYEHSKFMGINSDEAGTGVTIHDFAISPEIDLSSITQTELTFDYCFNDDGTTSHNSILNLLYRNSTSDNWQTIKTYDNVSQFDWKEETIRFAPSTPSATTQFAFEYDDFGNKAYGAGFDNFKVSLNSKIENNIINKNMLKQNYPNPFNPETIISFRLEKEVKINISVYNIKGELVKTLANNKFNAGIHNIKFNAINLNSGVYYYTLKTQNQIFSKKMLLVK